MKEHLAISNWQLAKQNQPQKQKLTADCADQRGLEKSSVGYWVKTNATAKIEATTKTKVKIHKARAKSREPIADQQWIEQELLTRR